MTAEDLRCDSKLHGVLRDGQLEVKCSSRWCTGEKGAVVLHYFSLESGELVSTRRFRDPRLEG